MEGVVGHVRGWLSLVSGVRLGLWYGRYGKFCDVNV